MPALLGTSYIERLAKAIFPPERMIVPYNAKPLRILAIKDAQVERKSEEENKVQNVMVIEDDAKRLVRVARKMLIPPRSEGAILVVTGSKELVPIGPLLD